jgi:prolyl-tRNA synthetase
VLADSGEDAIAVSDSSSYAANVEMAEAIAPEQSSNAIRPMREVDTPEQKTIESVCRFLELDVTSSIKTLIVLGEPDENDARPLVALVLRGDHKLNDIKAEKLPGIASPLEFAPEERIKNEIGAEVGSLGPIGLSIQTYVDHSAASLRNFCCGANKTGVHYVDANWPDTTFTPADLREVVEGDPSPCGNGKLLIKRGIEVGHIFQLGTKYSDNMGAKIQDPNGKDQSMTMGCYGIGVTRVVAAAIEQNHDANGIIWPQSIAPFALAIVPINPHKSALVAEKCEDIYKQLTELGIDVLYMDEDKARLGSMLADIELIGIPHRIVVGERGLTNGEIEYRGRRDSENTMLSAESIIDEVIARLGH